MSRYYNDISYSPAVLQHSGIKGMHWHERRYQNEDGTLTEEGKKRYSKAKSSFDKADAKAAKYRSKAEAKEKKYEPKIQKAQMKAERAKVKAYKNVSLAGLSDFDKQIKYNSMPERQKKRYNKQMVKVGRAETKVSRLQYKSDKLNYKADKYLNKGQKIADKLARDFENDGSTLSTPLTASRAALGKKRADAIMQQNINQMLYDQLDKKNRIEAARKEVGWDGKIYKK